MSHSASEGVAPPARQGARRRLRHPGWTAATLAVAGLIALPIVAVLLHVFLPSDGVWTHLAQTVLPLYLGNTLLLAAMTVALTLVIGVPAGWLIAANL